MTHEQLSLPPTQRLRFLERALGEARSFEKEESSLLAERQKDVERFGHRLKGSAPTFGFDWLSTVGARIEDDARESSGAERVHSTLRLLLEKAERERELLLRMIEGESTASN